MMLAGLTLHTFGAVLIAYTAMSVHFRFWREHKVDEQVFSEMKKERFVGVAGVAMIIVGYLLQAISIAR
jgi:hypothetical protein